MSTVTLPTPAPAAPGTELDAFVELMLRLRPGKAAYLDGVTWDEYAQFDRRRDELRPNVKLTYDRGGLEVMTTSYAHDHASERLNDIVKQVGLELDVPFEPAGRTTFRREDVERGLEPDQCYYVQNVTALTGVREIDLTVHPPPDLAVEVEHTRSSLPKQPIYAALGVPEVWRFDGVAVTFLILQPGGGYQPQPTSRAFPVVTSADVTRLVLMAAATHNAFLRAVQAWVRTLAPQQP
jgi:Uma2 family endonuclease